MKFGVPLSAIYTRLETSHGVLDNWFERPLALTFWNTPKMTDTSAVSMLQSLTAHHEQPTAGTPWELGLGSRQLNLGPQSSVTLLPVTLSLWPPKLSMWPPSWARDPHVPLTPAYQPWVSHIPHTSISALGFTHSTHPGTI